MQMRGHSKSEPPYVGSYVNSYKKTSPSPLRSLRYLL